MRQSDAISLRVLDRTMELPAAAGHGEFADSGFEPSLMPLDASRQMRVRMSHRSGRGGVESVSHRARAALLGSLALAFPTLLTNLHGWYADDFHDPVCRTSTVGALLRSTRSMVGGRISSDDGEKILRPTWFVAA